MSVLTDEEREQIKELQRKKILSSFREGEITGLTQNGGVSIFCGDGDIDAPEYHKRVIHPRRHNISVFGGFLVFCKSYKIYDTGLAEGLLRNAKLGMKAKDTSSIFLYPHWPCQAGKEYGYSMLDMIDMLPEAVEVFRIYSEIEKIHILFHTMRISKHGHLQHNTYKLILPEGR
jgi:hypothetical protein